MTSNARQRIKSILVEKGYKTVEFDTSPKEFSLNPDIYGQTGKKAIAFYLRNGREPPHFMLQKIGLVKSIMDELVIYIVFLKKTRKSAVKNISLYGIGVALFQKGVLKIQSESRNFSKKASKLRKRVMKKMRKIETINLFPSSIQKAEERKVIIKIVEEIGGTFDVPIFGKLVEKDSSFTIDKVRENILKLLGQSDILVGVLTEEFRELVGFEIRKSFDFLSRKRIIILVKDVSRETRDKDQNRLISWLKKQNGFKYLPYSNLKDFECTARREIYFKVKSIYEEEGVEYPI